VNNAAETTATTLRQRARPAKMPVFPRSAATAVTGRQAWETPAPRVCNGAHPTFRPRWVARL